MKFRTWLFPLALSLFLLSACGGRDLPAEVSVPGETEVPATGTGPGLGTVSLEHDEEPMVITCRIVDGAEDGDLLLAELEDGLYGGTGVYRLNVEGVPVTLDGKAADAAALEDGMPIDVAFNGQVMETFPAQMGEVYSITAWSRGQGKNPMGTEYDLCGLYLQVLDDLWEKDPALNETIRLAGLDLGEAPGVLGESEKAAIAWRFGETHSVEVVTGTFEELKEQGYFTAKVLRYTDDGIVQRKESVVGPEFYEWEDGCLFSITPNRDHADEAYSLPVLFFNAEKWRAPLAAYSFYDCSAMWAEAGSWSGYHIGSEMIA